MERPGARHFFVPVPYRELLAQAVAPWGVTAAMLFGGPEEEWMGGQPSNELRWTRAVTVIERARILSGEPGMGILLGLRATVAFFHAWSLQANAKSNHFVAVDASNAVALTFEATGTDAVVTVGERAPLGTARDFVLFATLVGLWQASRAAFGADLQATLAFAIPEPGYFRRFVHVLPPSQFGQPASSLRIRCRRPGGPRKRRGATTAPQG